MASGNRSRRACAAVILAAGQGTRMRSKTPKVLHTVGGRSMLHHVLSLVKQTAASPAMVIVGPHMQQVSDAVAAFDPAMGVRVQETPLGTAHAVLISQPLLDGFKGDVFILYADTPLIQVSTLDRMIAARAEGAQIVVLGFHSDHPTGYGRLLINEDGHLAGIVEQGEATSEQKAITFCNSGVMLIDGSILFELLDQVACDNAKGEYYLTDIIAIARNRQYKSVAIACDETEVLGVNSRSELAQAEAGFQKRMRIAAMDEGATLIEPDSVFFSYDTDLGQDVTILPNVFFGPGVTIDDNVTVKSFSHLEGTTIGQEAQIGPFARLRPGADIGEGARIGNFVEIKKSVVEEGAKINHLTYIGDTFVGAGANIGAGTITCNYDGFDKHETHIGRGAFIGSNNCLVAPVRIADGAYTGAGSVISADVSEGALALTRVAQKEIPGWVAKFKAKSKASES